MNELKSYTEYAVSTPTADFVIGFDFNYGEDAVNVTVDDVPATTAGYTVVYLNETTIRLSPSVPSGVVRLQRETDIDQSDHAYRAGAKFIAQTMDENFEQLRHSQQEVRDGFNKLADDTYEIIDTLQDVGQAAQDAADAAEQAAITANDAAAQVNDKVSYQDLDSVIAATPHNTMSGRDAAGAHPASAISYSTISQEVYNDGFSSIAEILSITSPKDGMRVFASGQQHGWFKHNSARISENDGGTIFNGWERIDFDHITFDMFGCDQNGLIAIDDKLLKICAASTALKKPIHNFSGTYLVNSANEFIFTENTLLDGSVFKLGSNFSGKFTCTRSDIISTTLTSGVDFDSIKAVGTLQRGRNKLNAIGLDSYPDHYAKFETSQPLYIYRGDTKTAPLFTRILRNRTLLSAPMFDLDLSQLTAIKLQRVASSIRLFSGFCFDETNATNLGLYFNAIDSNSIVLRTIRYIDNSTINRSGNQYRFNVLGCYGVLLSSINAVSAMQNADNTFNYTLNLSNSYDVLVDGLRAFGDGWGSTGSNSCARIEFKNSDVNRIDFHEPCYEYLKIKDCNIGVWGILVTMIGDLHISDSTEITHEGVGSRGYIRSRPDAGGFCYGDLHINNLTLLGYNGNNREFIVAEGNGVLPVGSPISPVMFENIYINNIKSKQSLSNVSKLLVSLTVGTALLPPKKISIDKLTGFNPEVDFGGFALRSGVVRLDYLNVDNPYLYIADSSDKGTKIKVKIFNLSANGSPSTVLNTANADIDIIESNLVWYREYYNKWNAFSPKVRINGGEISDQSPVSLPTGVTNSRVRLNNVNITATGMESLIGNLLPKAKFTGCLFGFTGFISLWTGSGVSTGSANIHASAGLVNFVFGYGGARRCIDIDVSSSATYTIETGVTVVVAVSGSTATVTLNATNANLIGFVSSK